MLQCVVLLPICCSRCCFNNMNYYSCTSPNNTCVDNDQSHFSESNTQFLIYFGIRVGQVIVAITGNVCTLIIISKLKHRVNGHIIMVYLAVSDILVCCMLPMSYLRMSSTIDERQWKNFCIISEFFYTATMTYSVVSYITASIDRYVKFIHSLCLLPSATRVMFSQASVSHSVHRGRVW